jgi:hypothetical protein
MLISVKQNLLNTNIWFLKKEKKKSRKRFYLFSIFFKYRIPFDKVLSHASDNLMAALHPEKNSLSSLFSFGFFLKTRFLA